MHSTVSTKLLVPEIASPLVIRPGLMALFDHGLQRRLTLVVAPAGYGKTTSVAMWLQSLRDQESASRREPTATTRMAWYALDEEDDDASTFFTRFVAAIEAAVPNQLAPVATGLTIHELAPGQHAHLLADACLKLSEQVVLVVDDYHLITHPEIHATIEFLIQYAWSKLHLVIVTRHDPPLSIPRLRARREVFEIRSAALRLSEEEATRFIESQLDPPPPAAFITLLQERTEGWITGLQLAVAAAHVHDNLPQFLLDFQRYDSVYILDYLFDEVLDRASDEIKEFLLKTSLLTRFDANLAAFVLQTDAAACQRMIEQLRRQNLFIVVLDTEQSWIRYHRQFQAMLAGRAQIILGVDFTSRIRLAAAAWLVEHGWIDEALAQYLADQAWNAAAELVTADRHRLQNREEWQLLWHRIAQLPEETVARRPALRLAQAWILQVQNRNSAIPGLVEQAAAALPADATGDESAHQLWAEIYALRGSWIFPDTPAVQRLEYLQAALDRLPAPQYAWIRGFIYIQMAYLRVGLGQRNLAHQDLIREIHAHAVGAKSYLVRLYHALATIAYWDGSLAELQQVAKRYQELASGSSLPMAVAWARYARAWAYYQNCAMEQAWAVLLPIFERPYDANLQSVCLALAIMVPAAAELGYERQAESLLEEIRSVAAARESIAAADEITALTAQAELLWGDEQAALVWADRFSQRFSQILSEHQNSPGLTIQVLVQAKIVLAAGSTEQIRNAIELLRAFIQQSQQTGRVVHVIQGMALLACCCWRTGRTQEALAWLQQSVEIGVGRGYRRVFYELGRDVAPMLYAMPERNDQGSAVARLLRDYLALDIVLPHHPTNADVGAEYLTEREIDILSLMAEHLSNKEIARRLDISPFTVRNHSSNIYSKLNVATRRQAVSRARSLGLLTTT